ncbi:type 1 glutamine amidotransferase [Rheinheimera sp.]|uniref:type 1 glutamine amidotransferase n=1 Tax=Rheinheimera sp. TaxID=1869214 RepID=UPI00307D9BEE
MMFRRIKPIAVCQHHSAQGPAYLQQYLEWCDCPYQLFRVDQGEMPPQSSKDFSALVVLGSDRSVNDKQPWIRKELQLVKDALERQKPVLGHCFGGQLLAKALGASVRPNAVPQIGWDKVRVTAYAQAKCLLRAEQDVLMFHWHFETFQIPAGARRLLFGQYCLNKGFVYGPHLGLQSHLEVTADSIRQWCLQDEAVLQRYQHLPSVQSVSQIQHQLEQKVAQLHQCANQIYHSWLRHLPGMAGLPLPLRLVG